MPESITSAIIEEIQKPLHSAGIFTDTTFFILDENGKLLFHGLPTKAETALDYKEKKITEIEKKKDTAPTTTTLDQKEKELKIDIEKEKSPHTHAFISAKIYFQGKLAEIILMHPINKGESNHAALYMKLTNIFKYINVKAKKENDTNPTLSKDLLQFGKEIDLSPVVEGTYGNYKTQLGNYHFSGECHYESFNKELNKTALKRYETKKQEQGLLADISISLKGSQTTKVHRNANYEINFEAIPATLEKNKIYIEIKDRKVFYALINENNEKIKKILHTTLPIKESTPTTTEEREEIESEVIAFLKETGEIGRTLYLQTAIPIENIEMRRDKYDSRILLKTDGIDQSHSPKDSPRFLSRFFEKRKGSDPTKTLEEKHDGRAHPSSKIK